MNSGGSVYLDRLSFFLLMASVTFLWLMRGCLRKKSNTLIWGSAVILVASSFGFALFLHSLSDVSSVSGFSLVLISLNLLLAYFDRSLEALEAARKFFILSGLAWSIGLIGVAMLESALPNHDLRILTYGLVLILFALLFFLGAVPFQFAIPDVSQGTQPAVAFYFQITTQAAALFALQLFILAAPIHHGLITLLKISAGASLLFGGLAAMPQRNLRRLLGYARIASAGWGLLLVVSITDQVHQEAILWIFMVTNALSFGAVFYALDWLEQRGEGREVHHLAGLWERSPLLAGTLLAGLFSLLGLPPWAGFTSLWKIWKLAAAEHQPVLLGLSLLALVALLNAFLGVAKMIFWSAPRRASKLALSRREEMTLWVLLSLLLGLGFWPGWTELMR